MLELVYTIEHEGINRIGPFNPLKEKELRDPNKYSSQIIHVPS